MVGADTFLSAFYIGLLIALRLWVVLSQAER